MQFTSKTKKEIVSVSSVHAGVNKIQMNCGEQLQVEITDILGNVRKISILGSGVVTLIEDDESGDALLLKRSSNYAMIGKNVLSARTKNSPA
jgi:hypothetical protein